MPLLYEGRSRLGYTQLSHKTNEFLVKKKACSGALSAQVEKVFLDIGRQNMFFPISQNMVHERTGEHVSYSQIHYLSGRNGKDSNDIKTSGDDLVNFMREIGQCIYSFLLHKIEEDEQPLSNKSLKFQRLCESTYHPETMRNGEVKYLKEHVFTMERRIKKYRLLHVVSKRTTQKLLESTTQLIIEDNKALEKENKLSLQ